MILFFLGLVQFDVRLGNGLWHEVVSRQYQYCLSHVIQRTNILADSFAGDRECPILRVVSNTELFVLTAHEPIHIPKAVSQ